MKKRYFHLSPKLTLALSAILLLLALGYLWTALDYPMPSRELALRKAELRENLPHGEVVARVDLERELNSGEGDPLFAWGSHCLFTRREDQFYVLFTSRSAALLWGPSYFMPLLPQYPMGLASDYHYDVTNGVISSDGVTQLTAVAVAEPAAARVTMTQALCPSDVYRAGDEVEYLEQHGVTVDCTETSPGSGIWLGRQRIPQPSGDANGYTHSSLARVYDAAGNLLYTTAGS